MIDKHKLSLALGIISGRIECDEIFDIDLEMLGISASDFELFGSDELKRRAEAIIIDALEGRIF